MRQFQLLPVTLLTAMIGLAAASWTLQGYEDMDCQGAAGNLHTFDVETVGQCVETIDRRSCYFNDDGPGGYVYRVVGSYDCDDFGCGYGDIDTGRATRDGPGCLNLMTPIGKTPHHGSFAADGELNCFAGKKLLIECRRAFQQREPGIGEHN